MTDDQSPNARVLSDATDHRRCSVQSAGCACGNGEMHDQDMRSPRELDELWVCAVLIGAEDDRHITRLYAICQSRDIAVWYSQRGHGHSMPVEHRRWFCLRHINDTDIETNASPHAGHDRITQRRAKHLKCALLRIEEATEERRKVWHQIVPGRTGTRQWLFPSLIAQP